MFITGPNVVKAVMQEEVTLEELGGGLIHSTESGVSHFLAKDDRECLAMVRSLLAYLPSNNQDDPPYVPPRRRAGVVPNWSGSFPSSRTSPTTCARSSPALSTTGVSSRCTNCGPRTWWSALRGSTAG